MGLVSDLQKDIRGMDDAEAVGYLLGVVQAMLECPESRMIELREAGFEGGPQVLSLISTLAQARGRTVPREAMQEAVTRDLREVSKPDVRLDVVLTKARKACAPFGLIIRNEYGVGHSMVRPDGFLFPWESR